MNGLIPLRVLLLRGSASAALPDWRELERRLPGAEILADREAAARRLEETEVDLILADAVLPDGGPYGLLGALLTRRLPTTVVVRYRLEAGPRWLRLFANGAFDLQAEPMTSEEFLHWLDTWQAPAAPEPARAVSAA